MNSITGDLNNNSRQRKFEHFCSHFNLDVDATIYENILTKKKEIITRHIIIINHCWLCARGLINIIVRPPTTFLQ